MNPWLSYYRSHPIVIFDVQESNLQLISISVEHIDGNVGYYEHNTNEIANHWVLVSNYGDEWNDKSKLHV